MSEVNATPDQRPTITVYRRPDDAYVFDLGIEPPRAIGVVSAVLSQESPDQLRTLLPGKHEAAVKITYKRDIYEILGKRLGVYAAIVPGDIEPTS